MLGCLVEANQQWTKNAGVLMITVARRSFSRTGKPDRVAEHDVDLAVANLTAQATHLGLHVHQMAGIDLTKACHTYRIPDSHDPVTAIAMGYVAESSGDSSDHLAQRDHTPRSCKKLSEFVFAGAWNQPAPDVS